MKIRRILCQQSFCPTLEGFIVFSNPFEHLNYLKPKLVRTKSYLSGPIDPTSLLKGQIWKTRIDADRIHSICRSLSTAHDKCATFQPALHIQKLSKILKAEVHESFSYEQELKNLTAKTEQRVLNFSIYQLYQLLVLFSNQKRCPVPTLNVILMEIISKLEKNDITRQLSNSHISHLPLLISNIPLPEGANETILEFLNRYTSLINQYMNDHLNTIGSPYSETSTYFTKQELSFISLGLSNLRYQNRLFFHAIANYFIAISALESQQNRTDNRLNIGSALVNLFLSFSTSTITHPLFYQQLISDLCGHMDDYSASQITNIGIALATLSADPTFPLSLSFFKEFECSLKLNYLLFVPQDALVMCWVMCCLEIYKSLPDIFLELTKNFSSNLLQETQISPQMSIQVKQILLTIQLDNAHTTLEIIKDLKKNKFWNLLSQVRLIPEQPYEATDLEQYVKSMLEDPKRVHPLFIALCKAANLPKETSYETRISFNTIVGEIYSLPILFEILSPSITGFSDPSTSTTSLFKIAFSDHNNFGENSNYFLDPYETLKNQHLNKMEYIYVILPSVIQPDMTSESYDDFLVETVSQNYFQQKSN